MPTYPPSLTGHRVQTGDAGATLHGDVRWAPQQSLWFSAMATCALLGGAATLSWSALALFVCSTGFVLLFGHSLGSHRKLIHNSFHCPRWLEYFLVYCGVLVGLAGPLGLLRQHELRDYAQRLPDCHPYLRHGAGFWRDAWWQLHCELRLRAPPGIRIEPRIANDRFYQFLERTWMWQQLPWALLLFMWGGWAFVFWGVCARVTAGVFGHWLIGYFAHNHGSMHHAVKHAAVQGRNIRWTSLLTMGECWHNNHHAFPGSAKLGLAPGEWDPGWWALLALRRVGLVTNLRLPEHLPARPELARLRSRVSKRRAHSRNSVVEVVLTLPEKWVTAKRLQRAIGNGALVVAEPSARRAHLHHDGQAMATGLPALCLAYSSRGGVHRALAELLLLPIATKFERLRHVAAPRT
jgi:fatty-acid desaturase